MNSYTVLCHVAQYSVWNRWDRIWFHCLKTHQEKMSYYWHQQWMWPYIQRLNMPEFQLNCLTKSMILLSSDKSNMSVTEFEIYLIWYTRVKYCFIIFKTGSELCCIWHTKSLLVISSWTIIFVISTLHESTKPKPFGVLIFVILFLFQLLIKWFNYSI